MLKNNLNTIGERIKFIRREFLLTQVQFAQRLGVTNAHISKIEKGITSPSVALIKLICQSFKVSEHWLKEGIMPIYEEQVVDEAEENFGSATRMLNRLIKDKDPLTRLTISQLEKSFVQLADSEQVSENENERIKYLKMMLHLFDTLNDTLSIFKNTFPISEDVKNEIIKNELGDVEDTLRAMIKMITDSH